MHGPDPATPATTDDGRRLRRARPGGGRPSGRAVAGGLLVAVAAVLVFSAYAGAGERPTRSMVVARRALAPGHTITGDDVEVRTGDLPDELVGRSFTAVDEVLGAVALGPLGEGDLVQSGSVRQGAGDDRPEFSFPVEREQALAGDVRPGEEVDLLATFGSGSDAETVVLARGAQIREVDESRNGTIGSSGRLVLTVGLASGDEVLDLAHAAQVATITVVRAGGAGSAAGPARTSSATIEGRS
jgi:Flp pilus assembly protein CpaB